MGPGVLLSEPMASTDRCEVKNPRAQSSDYKNLSDEFVLNSDQRTYQRQFFHIYNARLNAMRSRVETSARKLLGEDVLIRNLSDLDSLAKSEDDTDKDSKDPEVVKAVIKVVVIGTIYKNQPLKPSILKDLSEEQGLLPQPAHTSYVSEEDEVVLEDNNCRIRLIFDEAAAAKGLRGATLATGVVCGIYGTEIRTGKGKGTTGGKFLVEEVVFAEKPVQTKLEPLKEDRFIAIASGLELSGSTCDVLSSLELAVAWLVGDAGEMEDQGFNAGIERFILAGNSVSEMTRNKDSANKARYLVKNEDAASVAAISNLDDILAELCVSIDVDVMPGEFDPANQILPQQPLHHCLFPQAAPYPSFRTVPNPYMFEVGGRLILGTSGQNIDDVLRNTSLPGPIEALESLLSWSHLAPTCPDTLGCFPFQDKDPFVLNRRPHILFAANQPKFDQRLITSPDGSRTLVISIPKFSSTPSVCLVNVTNLEAKQIHFCAQREL